MGAVSLGTWLFAISALVLWASAFAGIRAALAGLSPGHVVLLRFLVASGALLIYAALLRLPPPRAKDLPYFFFLGLLGVFGYHTALTYGEVTVTAGSAGLLIATAPIFIALFARLFLGERLERGAWLGMGLAFLGSALIAIGEGEGIGLDPGAFLVLLAAVSGSLYFVLQKPLFSRYPAATISVYTMVLGTLPLFVFSPGFLEALKKAPPEATYSAVYLGLFPGALAYMLWIKALERVPASLLGSTLYLNPALALFFAWLWLKEMPHPLALLGGALALVGVGLVQRAGR